MSLKNLKPQSMTKNPIARNTFRHCCVRFCWTTFLKTAVHQELMMKGGEVALVVRALDSGGSSFCVLGQVTIIGASLHPSV